MRRALSLAARARGRVSPNPLVGCVIARGARVLATGYHHQAGKAHAEVDALSKLGGRAPGATVYVTLEPCNHTGRTGPCTEALIEAGVAEVVCGMRDPNRKVAGRGLERLRRAGIRVRAGVLE
ncbi:MAG: bifunctional diaminohydroxyphosphoribosylaminopyrimidine deaminase/5-amino-6-(5-phosphoribosylamino)uracil reductase RibD, partial [Polyangia bacterium]